MKKPNERARYLPQMRLTLYVMIFLWTMASGIALAGTEQLSQCSCIEDDTKRLECYDRISGRSTQKTEPLESVAAQEAKRKKGTKSWLSKQWELEKDDTRGVHSIVMHRRNYILPYSYSTRPNQQPIAEVVPDHNLQKSEAVFQISFKTKLWQDILGKDMDLWFAYTQKSFWQMYDFENSSPFRETNYEPELLLNFKTDYEIFGLRGRMANIGFNHQSNGRSEPLSRSWNRIVGTIGLEKDNFTLLLNGWYRIPESGDEDDNPEMDEYLGHGQLQAYYDWNGHRFGAMVRNNLRKDNRGALMLDWSFPINNRISGYAQFFTGYGESLLDYDHSINRFGIGFTLSDWN